MVLIVFECRRDCYSLIAHTSILLFHPSIHYSINPVNSWSFFLKPFRRVFRSSVKKKLLTQEKYEEQGRVETDIALKELRNHCRQSSKFWDKTLNELSDQRQ